MTRGEMNKNRGLNYLLLILRHIVLVLIPMNTENTPIKAPKAQSTLFHGISLCAIVAMAFLLPIFFIPSPVFPFQFGKSMVVSLVVLVIFTVWTLTSLKNGKLALPHIPLLFTILLLPATFLLSALNSPAIGVSLVGGGFETGTFSFMAAMMLLFVTTPVIFRSRTHIFYVYLALLGSFIIMALFHGARLIFGFDAFSFSIFTTSVSNLLGKWNDLGIFFGLIAMLTLVTIELLSLNKLFKLALYALFLLSTFFLALVNFSIVWVVLGIFSLVFFVYTQTVGQARLYGKAAGGAEDGSGEARGRNSLSRFRKIPYTALIFLILAVIFVMADDRVGQILSNSFGISHIEARPSWSSTLSIAKETLKEHPLLGAGPNRFVNQWLLHKPEGINTTDFWGVDFPVGIGLIPTFLVTTGLAGMLAWLLFLGFLFYLGFRWILMPRDDPMGYYLIVSSFLGALYLWLLAILYTPGVVTVTLAFLFSGLFVAALQQEKLLGSTLWNFADNPRSSFTASMLLIVFLIAGVSGGYVLTQKYLSRIYFQKGVQALQDAGDTSEAERYAKKAIDLDASDAYYRFLSRLNIFQLQEILSKSDISIDTARSRFQDTLGDAITHARKAIDEDNTNYQNWVSLGRVYGAVVPLGVEGAFDSAKTAYEKAIELSPHSPALYLAMARLSAAKGDNEGARKAIAEALTRKNNYAEAVFFLSRLEVAEGNLEAAIASTETASLIAPNDQAVFFQLGLLRYNKGDYSGTVSALERAVELNKEYSNARYFLGLSYAKLGRTDDAIKQFEEIEKFNPDNEEVKLILRNLRSGKEPFADANPPVPPPEERETLPLEEE
jgi:tetratricopeptide (TPR) repeat protein